MLTNYPKRKLLNINYSIYQLIISFSTVPSTGHLSHFAVEYAHPHFMQNTIEVSGIPMSYLLNESVKTYCLTKGANQQ